MSDLPLYIRSYNELAPACWALLYIHGTDCPAVFPKCLGCPSLA